MSGKFEEMINNAKITELLNKKKAEPRVIDYNHQMRAPPRRYGRKSILRRKKQ